MPFVIKAEVRSLRATKLAFAAQKTMYGGKHIAEGDAVFIFAISDATAAFLDQFF